VKPEVARFVEEMLGRIRREFFAQHTDKRFFQERSMLIQAITYPAHWMNDRGAKLPASGYRRILGTVIDTIMRRGNRAKIQRFWSIFCIPSRITRSTTVTNITMRPKLRIRSQPSSPARSGASGQNAGPARKPRS